MYSPTSQERHGRDRHKSRPRMLDSTPTLGNKSQTPEINLAMQNNKKKSSISQTPHYVITPIAPNIRTNSALFPSSLIRFTLLRISLATLFCGGGPEYLHTG